MIWKNEYTQSKVFDGERVWRSERIAEWLPRRGELLRSRQQLLVIRTQFKKKAWCQQTAISLFHLQNLIAMSGTTVLCKERVFCEACTNAPWKEMDERSSQAQGEMRTERISGYKEVDVEKKNSACSYAALNLEEKLIEGGRGAEADGI